MRAGMFLLSVKPGWTALGLGIFPVFTLTQVHKYGHENMSERPTEREERRGGQGQKVGPLNGTTEWT